MPFLTCLVYFPQKDIHNQGLAVILASNPRNPTGQVIQCVRDHLRVDPANLTTLGERT